MGMQLIISFLVAVATISLGATLLLVLRMRRETRITRSRALQDELHGGGATRAERERPSELQRSVRRLGEMVSQREISDQLRKGLASAGIYAPSAPATYLGYKLVFFVLGFAGLAVLLGPLEMEFTQRVLLIALGSAFFFFLPNMVLARKRANRRKEVQRHLPDAVDMLEICVSAGMGLDAAWNSVAEESRKVSAI